MENRESSSRGYGMKIVIGVMLCLLIFLGVILFSINSKLANLQTSMEERITALEMRQDSIERGFGFLKDVQPEIENLQRRWADVKEKVAIIRGAVEKFIDEFLESLSTEQEERVKQAVDKLFRLMEAFSEFAEELEAERDQPEKGRQTEGDKG
jgi:hypothetical protein